MQHTNTRCIVCEGPLRGAQWMRDGWACEACYFRSLGELVEQHPIPSEHAAGRAGPARPAEYPRENLPFHRPGCQGPVPDEEKAEARPADMLRIDVDNGKYTVVQDAAGRLYALRYGETWRDLCGDNLVAALAYELGDARNKIKAAVARIEAIERLLANR